MNKVDNTQKEKANGTLVLLPVNHLNRNQLYHLKEKYQPSSTKALLTTSFVKADLAENHEGVTLKIPCK